MSLYVYGPKAAWDQHDLLVQENGRKVAGSSPRTAADCNTPEI